METASIHVRRRRSDIVLICLAIGSDQSFKGRLLLLLEMCGARPEGAIKHLRLFVFDFLTVSRESVAVAHSSIAVDRGCLSMAKPLVAIVGAGPSGLVRFLLGENVPSKCIWRDSATARRCHSASGETRPAALQVFLPPFFSKSTDWLFRHALGSV